MLIAGPRPTPVRTRRPRQGAARARVLVATAIAAALLAAAAAAPLAAQSAPPPAVAPLPPTIEACYVPASGTVYRINTTASPAAGAPQQCLSATHVRFTWNQQGLPGPAGPKGDRGDPGPPGTATVGPDLDLPGRLGVGGAAALAGGLTLSPPAGFTPTAQLLQLRDAPAGGGALTFGVSPAGHVVARSLSLNGNASVGGGLTVNAGATITGALSAAGSAALGPRAAVNGRTGAFAFGDNSTTTPLSADADNQFVVRAAGGVKLRTSADQSKGCNVDGGGNLVCTGSITAAGAFAAAGAGGGQGAFAFGMHSGALGVNSLAVGFNAVAEGAASVALGTDVRASARGATALGTGAFAQSEGSFVFGDVSSRTAVSSETSNQFLVRAAGGVRLRTSPDLSRGCDVSPQGELACTGRIALAGSLSVVRQSGPWTTLAAPGQDDVRATCPAGTTLLGGGVETTGAIVRLAYVSFDHAIPETYRANVRNEGPSPIQARVTVSCLRLTP